MTLDLPTRHRFASPCRLQPQADLNAKVDAAGQQQVLVRGATAIIPQKMICDGEVIILAVKPSLWFIPLVSLRWLVGALLAIALAELVIEPYVRMFDLAQRVEQVAILTAAIRLILATLEWLGRVYVLTDRRVMRLKGVVHIDLFECGLGRVQQTELSMPLAERLAGCGTILFYTAGTGSADAAWETLAHPARVYQTVIETMERYHRQNRGLGVV